MTPRLLLALALSLASPTCGGEGDGATTPTPQPAASAGAPYPGTPLLANGLRNKYKWPFASDSIWNVPIGSGARYVPPGIAVATARGITVDEDLIVPRADAPLEPVVVTDAGWDPAKTSQDRFPDENIGIGAGNAGAHGASGMSSIGGTVRVGEIVPGGAIRHALKINVFGRKNYHYDGREAAPGYRWPAKSADGYAGDPKSSCAYGGACPRCASARSWP